MCRLRTNFARLGDPLQGRHNRNAPLLPPSAASLHWKACHWILSRLLAPYESSSFATPEGEILVVLSFVELMKLDGKRRADFPLRGKYRHRRG